MGISFYSTIRKFVFNKFFVWQLSNFFDHANIHSINCGQTISSLSFRNVALRISRLIYLVTNVRSLEGSKTFDVLWGTKPLIPLILLKDYYKVFPRYLIFTSNFLLVREWNPYFSVMFLTKRIWLSKSLTFI